MFRFGTLMLASFVLLAVLGGQAATQAPNIAESACLSAQLNSITSKLGGGVGYKAIVQPGVIKAWNWVPSSDHSSGNWKLGRFRGAAIGNQPPPNDSKDVWVWPTAIAGRGANVCSAAFLGAAFSTLAHEAMHFLCPKHSGSGADTSDPETPPAQDGTPPDCNDLNYAVGAAAQVCDQMNEAQECKSDPDCEGMTDADGNVIEGLEKENLPEYCEGLAKSHSDMQTRHNTSGNAATAFACNCPDPWSPGAGFSNCPTMGSPPGGCDGNASDAYPDNKVIPDCE